MLLQSKMALARKTTTVWDFYDAHRADTGSPSGYGNALWDGVVMKWMDDTFAATPLGEYQPSKGPIWAMHLGASGSFPNGGAYPGERGAPAGNVDSIPLTNGVTNAYIYLVFPTPRILKSWRGHNLNGDWAAGRVPKSTRMDVKRTSDNTWVTVDTGPAIPNGTGDTGYRSITGAPPAAEYRLYLAGDGTNSAQSLCFLDLTF